MNSDKFKAYAKKYAIVVGIILGAFLIIGGAAVFVYRSMQSSAADNSTPPPLPDGIVDGSDGTGVLPNGGTGSDPFAPPDRTTALVLGVNGGLSDVMLLVTFDAITNKIDVISIQRDTLITLPKEDVDALHALGRRATPSSGVMKLGELHSYAGDTYGPEYAKKFVQNMLEVNIDYTVVINTKAFRYIVDAVGGIWMDVRPQGYKYSDPEQNLYINVPGGRQLLDGKNAEGVVRFRNDYRDGDLDRIKVVQEFVKNFYEQVLTRDNIKDNWLSFISTAISYVKTDFGIDDIPKYLTSIEKLKPENIEFHSLPGVPEYIDGGWYYIYSPAEGKGMISEIFAAKEPASQGDSSAKNITVDKSLVIQILNGTHANRLAARKGEQLANDGYNIKDVATYQGVKQPETRIVVKNRDLGEQFVSYFNNAIIEIDSNITKPYDVIIVVGTGETE